MRTLEQKTIASDLIVVGGGLAGVCCAITAAREGIDVALVQDRPVLGGNSSSEVRLWVLGATSHMGNNNRWAREGGVIDEILVENLWRNPEGNPVIFDSIVLEKVVNEPGITLLLNTSVHGLRMRDAECIEEVEAFNSQNQTSYRLRAPLFVDASGDGILGFLSGAEFRIGAEASAEFGEGLAPAQPEHSLLGHSLYFYSRNTGAPVPYVAPSFALKDITQIPRYRELRVSDTGCRLWWLEYGGDFDTVLQTEEIKWELWRVAYGVWDYIKNSGNFPDAENLTLEWMGMVPGKRESRRFMGDLILTQKDVIEQTSFDDAVSFGGWAIDLHPARGVFSPQPGCIQWHSKGVYQIPYRALYSRNIRNLFLSGRLISATHIAFGSTRVMGTCAHNGQAVGMAAVLCDREGLLPRDLLQPARMKELQQKLLQRGQHIPGHRLEDDEDYAPHASITASSSLRLAQFAASGELAVPDIDYALLLPVPAGPMPKVTLQCRASRRTTVHAELWSASRPGNTTPDVLLASVDVPVEAGDAVDVPIHFAVSISATAHLFVIVPAFQDGVLALSRDVAPGVMTLSQKMNSAVAKSPVQTPPEGSGVDTFAFWLPDRRPAARNLAARIEPPVDLFGPEMSVNGFTRPWCGVNAWTPGPNDPTPQLTLSWETPQPIREISLVFDTDFDHPMESVLLQHPERVIPCCITSFIIKTAEGKTLARVGDNHQTRWRLMMDEPCKTRGITVEILGHGPAPPSIFHISCR